MSEYDMSIHQNPDARAWARFYTETRNQSADPANFDSEDNMLGWFANAMMAMHDHLHGGGPMNGDQAEYMMAQEAALAAAPAAAPQPAPGHTDMMVTPEALDAWLADNPPPHDLGDREALVEALAGMIYDNIPASCGVTDSVILEIADAILAAGWRGPDASETLAWAKPKPEGESSEGV